VNTTALILCFPLILNPSDNRQRLDSAHALFHRGYYARAYELFETAIDAPQGSLAAHLGMAECCLAQGRHDAALNYLDDVHSDRRDAQWRRIKAETCAQLGRYTEALDFLRAALNNEPDNAQVRYVLGQLYETVGALESAVDVYAWFNDRLKSDLPEEPTSLHYTGMGFYRWSVLNRVDNLPFRTKHVLQEVLQPACMVLDQTYWPARAAMAELLFQKHKDQEALEDYIAVLELNPSALQAHHGIGSIAMRGWDFQNVERRIHLCLDINPRYAPAFVLLAQLRMTERRFEDAADAAQLALDINPNDLEALGYLAAAHLRLGRPSESESVIARARQINPQPAVVHTILGKQLSDARQFAEAEAHLNTAMSFDPSAAPPREELAMMYMQWGKEDLARDTADEAFKLDSFNSRIFNTLDLLDRLGEFGQRTTEHFEIHFDPAHDAVMGEYMGDYLEEVFEELTSDYDTDLKDKTIIEVFPDHREFGVRIHGKPWIHTVGACTGRVIAMDAPRVGVSRPYHYASVLRHEFTHTVTLAATNNRIPHWLTEGLAVLQEDRQRSWMWSEMLANRLRTNSLFSISEIDWGFIRPRRQDDRQVAYAQSEWMCEFLIDRFGYDIINEILKRIRGGEVLADIIAKLCKWTPHQFDEQFRAYARAEAADWGLPLDAPVDDQALGWLLQIYPDHAGLWAERADRQLQEGQFEAAQVASDLALEIDDSDEVALKVAARMRVSQANRVQSRNEAMQLLDQSQELYAKLAALYPDDPVAPAALAQAALSDEDHPAAEKWALKLRALQPRNPASHRVLSACYLHSKQDEQALSELLAMQQHDENNPDAARQIARIYLDRNNKQEAAYWFRESIHIDAYDAATHRQLGELLLELGRTTEAIREYRVLTMLEPQSARSFTDLAMAHHRVGDQDAARDAARRAVALDPNSPARQFLDP
jgi:tetratricopeptide (TPR) repeat protein